MTMKRVSWLVAIEKGVSLACALVMLMIAATLLVWAVVKRLFTSMMDRRGS